MNPICIINGQEVVFNCFKVVAAHTLQSCRCRNEAYVVRYKVGEYVTPKLGGCFTFRSLSRAYEFASYPHGDVIYLASGLGNMKVPDWLLGMDILNDDNEQFVRYWRMTVHERNASLFTKNHTPLGTRIYSSVCLIAPISIDDISKTGWIGEGTPEALKMGLTENSINIPGLVFKQ